jgi:hypothetical protein
MPVKSLNAHGLTYISSFIFVKADKHILQLYLYPVIQVLAVKNCERKMSHECSPLPPSSPSVRRQRQSFSFLTTCSTILKPEPLCVSLLTVAGQPPG